MATIFLWAAASALLLVTIASGHTHHCRPKVPIMTNFNESRFATGVWYLDSSDLWSWVTDKCSAWQFHWNAKPFTHHNQQYEGYFDYHWRRVADEGPSCWKVCSFSRAGYMHGSIGRDEVDHCQFGEAMNKTTTTTIGLRNSDPCHPHASVPWYLWTIETDYDSYALMWLCVAKHKQIVFLLARSDKGLSHDTRQAAIEYLEKHGFNTTFRRTHNTACH